MLAELDRMSWRRFQVLLWGLSSESGWARVVLESQPAVPAGDVEVVGAGAW